MKKRVLSVLLIVPMLFCLVGSLSCKQEKTPINAVVTVEFSDTEAPFTKESDDLLEKAFISDENSLKNYVYKNSSGRVVVNTSFVGKVKIQKKIDYFMPRYEYNYSEGEYIEVNPIGYDNRLYGEDGEVATSGKQSVERFYREQELLFLATQGLKSLGKHITVKNLTVIPSKLNRGVVTNTIFWPHQSISYTGSGEELSSVYQMTVSKEIKEVKIGNKPINSYILIPYAFIYNGEELMTNTLCHEYMHSLGAPDLYSYENSKEAVGEFDIMGGKDTAIPNLSLSYVRAKLGFIDEGKHILPITQSGEYRLFPAESDSEVKAYKITQSEYISKGESFYIEYRNLGKGSLTEVDTEGIIIYRVNQDNGYINQSGEQTNRWSGNTYGENEVYLFRYWRELFGFSEQRDEITKNDICYATVADKEGYKIYGNTEVSKNAITYSDGQNSGITVEYLGKNSDGSVNVRVDIPPQSQRESIAQSLTARVGNYHTLYFDGNKRGNAHIVVCENKIRRAKAQKLVEGKYGKVITVSTDLLKYDLARFGGYERYVYLCYEDENGLSAVSEYHVKGIKNVNIITVVIVAGVVGFLLPSAVIKGLTVIKKRRSEKHEN